MEKSHLSFIQKGKGKDMLLLHGYLSSKEAFTPQINYFSRFYRVTAIDFLGFGQSGALSSPFSVGDYADWLQEAMGTLGLQTPHVIAHSFGCRVAVKLASRENGAFDKLVLTGPAGIITNRGLFYKIKVKSYKILKKFSPQWAEKHCGSAEYRTLSPVMKESYKKIVNEDLRGCAAKVENAVLLIEGRRDTVTPLKEAKIYQNAFPRATLRQIEGGHFAFVERSLDFNLIAEEFFYG